MYHHLSTVAALVILATQIAEASPTRQGTPIQFGYRETLNMKGGAEKRYLLHLELGQVAEGSADQDGIDVVVETYDPQGARVDSFDSPNGRVGPEPFTVVGKVAGVYAVVIKPLAPDAVSGRVIFHLDRLLTRSEYLDTLLDRAYSEPPIAELAKDVRRRGASSAVADFVAKNKGKYPLVTPRKDGLVDLTFVYVATPNTDFVALQGPSFASFSTPLSRLPGTDVWYITEPAPPNSQFVYSFGSRRVETIEEGVLVPKTHTGPDALNPVHFGAGSLLKLPGAPAEPYSTKKDGVAAGKLERASMESNVLKEKRTFSIYTPPDWDGRGKANLVIVFDGEGYGSAGPVPAPVVLDNLLTAGRIGPTVAILVDNMGKRNRDLTCSKPFATFIAEELVPWAKKHYAISSDPHRTVVAGASFGGLCSAYVAHEYPRVLGSVLSQSGSYWFYPTWETAPGELQTMQEQSLIQSYFDSPRLPLHIYMEVGTFESDSMVQPNRRLRDILRLKGYPVTYKEYVDAHDFQTWRESLADGLIALIGKA